MEKDRRQKTGDRRQKTGDGRQERVGGLAKNQKGEGFPNQRKGQKGKGERLSDVEEL